MKRKKKTGWRLFENEMMVAFGGQLKDAVGDDDHPSKIHSYPNFELLEAAGQSQLDPENEKLIKLISRVLKSP